MVDRLGTRTGLPPALAALVEPPREDWQGHPEFGPLTRFWLDRHLGFRRVMDTLRVDLQERADGKLDPEAHASRLARLGQGLLGELEMHHSVEDQHYFPQLLALAPAISAGFELLDKDHHQLHEEMATFAEGAGRLLRATPGTPDQTNALGALERDLARFERFLDRHLTDEEDLIVPVILRVGERRLG